MTKRSKSRSHEWDDYDADYEWHSPRKRFRRNSIDGVIGGVCAGIGDYFNIDPLLVRIAVLVSVFVTGGVTFWVYVALMVLAPDDTRAPYAREHRQAYQAQKRRKDHPQDPPASTTNYRDVKSKFRSLETRLQDLERSITSSEWQLRSKFRDLDD